MRGPCTDLLSRLLASGFAASHHKSPVLEHALCQYFGSTLKSYGASVWEVRARSGIGKTVWDSPHLLESSRVLTIGCGWADLHAGSRVQAAH